MQDESRQPKGTARIGEEVFDMHNNTSSCGADDYISLSLVIMVIESFPGFVITVILAAVVIVKVMVGII